jgi:hypothetical protein
MVSLCATRSGDAEYKQTHLHIKIFISPTSVDFPKIWSVFETLDHFSAMITSLDNDFIESIIEKYGKKLLKINLSNNGKSVSFGIKSEWK